MGRMDQYVWVRSTDLLEVAFPTRISGGCPAAVLSVPHYCGTASPTPNSPRDRSRTTAAPARDRRSSKASVAGGVGDVGGGAVEEAVAGGLPDGGAGIHPHPGLRCAPPGRGRPARRLLRARPRHLLLHRRLHFPGPAGLLHHHRLARRDQPVQHAPRRRGGGRGRGRRDGVRAGRRRGQGVVPR